MRAVDGGADDQIADSLGRLGDDEVRALLLEAAADHDDVAQRARRAAGAAGLSEEFDDYLAALREHHRRRPTLIAMLGQGRPPVVPAGATTNAGISTFVET